MLKQLTQIWITYWLRLQSVITWLILACFMILFFYPRTPETWGTLQLAPSLTWYDSSQSQYFNLRKTQSSPTNKPISQLTDLKPTTRSLLIDSDSLTDLDTAQLKTLTQLQQLTLSTHSIPSNLLTTISPNLTELKIHSDILLRYTGELPSLNKLKLLITDNQNFNTALIQSIDKIPHLQTLVITDKADFQYETTDEDAIPGFNTISKSDLTPLLNRPDPVRIYANWSLDNNLPQLYPATIFPYFVNACSITMTLYCWSFLMLSWLSICEHNDTLFCRPASRLLPRFAFPHYLFKALSLCTLLLITCSALKIAQVSLMATLAASLAPITVCTAWDLFAKSQGYRWFLLMLSTFLFQYLILRNPLSPDSLSLAQNLLTGHFENLAAATALGQFIFIVASTVISTRHLGFTSNSRQTFFDRLLRLKRPARTLSHQHAQTFWKQVLLLRTGNNSYTGLSIIGITTVYLFIFSSDTDSRFFWTSLMTTSTMFLAGYMPTLATYWQNRQKFLEQEFLIPRTRSQFVYQLLTANAIEHLWFLAPYTTLLLFGFVQPAYREQAAQSLTTFPAMLSCLSLFLALNLNFLTFGKSRIEYNIMYFGAIITSIMILTMTTGTDPAYFNSRLIFALISLIICAPLCAIFITIAYKYALTHEWGESDT